MRARSVSETEGGGLSDWKRSDQPCLYCKSVGQRCYRVWESCDGAYADEKNECRACGRVWWDEGAESRLAGRRLPLPRPSASRRPSGTATARALLTLVSVGSLTGFVALKELVRRIGQ